MSASSSSKRAIRFLKNAQQADGSFIGYSAPPGKPITANQAYHTTFTPALILSCLCDVPGTLAVTSKLSTWLINQASGQWSFNYWAKDAPERTSLPYPDDLDDTFCALSALRLHNPELVDETAMGKSVRLLLAAETEKGGPYRTWLVPQDSPEVWLDVDLAVNCNIAYYLSLVAKPLPRLTALMDQAIANKNFHSPYYPNIYPVLYYLARAYTGDQKEALAAYITSSRKNHAWETPLQTALAISALYKLGATTGLDDAVSYLLASQQPDGSWPAEPFCLDPAKQNKPYVHGAAALTTAFVLEALHGYARPKTTNARETAAPKPPAANKEYQAIIAAAEEHFTACGAELHAAALPMLHKISHSANGPEIVLLPHLFARSLKPALPKPDKQTLDQLGLANLFGWIAYTIYDDFLDDEGDPTMLSVANASLRASVEAFRWALPGSQEFQELVQKIFGNIDSANAWEIANCRMAVKAGTISLKKLPRYKDITQLAERSLGHCLTPLGVLASIGISPGSKQAAALRHSLVHYLTARQLNDDAHDWQDDLSAGRISYVVADLLGGSGKTGKHKLTALMPGLRQQFWHTNVLSVCHQITTQTAAGRQAADTSDLLKPKNAICDLLDGIDAITERTVSEQTKAQKFLSAYET